MKNYEYLFIDMEWNAPFTNCNLTDCDAVSIGLIVADADLNFISSFSRGIAPRNPDLLTEKTCKIVHQTRENLMNANSERDVFKEIFMRFPTFKNVVVWNNDTYLQFIACAKRTGQHIYRHKVIVLQDVLSTIASKGITKYRFEEALVLAGVEIVPAFLHYAKHDVYYLYQLYKTTLEKYAHFTEGEVCVVNKRSKIVHMSNCRYVKKDNLEFMSKTIIFKGYKTCKCCGKSEEWNRFNWHKAKREKFPKTATNNGISKIRNKPLTDKNMKKYCKSLGLSCTVAAGVVFVQSPYGSWQLYLENGKVIKVLHENYRSADEKGTYHNQTVYSDNFFEVIRYIYFHDRAFVKRLCKKNRVEMILEQLQSEAN